jgi:hypothetical protein
MTGLAGLAQSAPVTETAAPVLSAEPEKKGTLLVFYTGQGQFEIIATEARAAQDALVLANSVWRSLAKPVGLPVSGFSSAVAVRLVPEKDWTAPAFFTVVAEPGGLVGVRICRGDKVDARIMRRALVQAVLLRQAVAWHGAKQGLTVPLWLEQACVALGEVRDRPAMLDAMQQESEQLAPPPLEELLRWQRGQAEERGRVLASYWLFQHLQDESGDMPRWARSVRAITGGADPMKALQDNYGTAWKDADSRELWWQVGFHNERLTSTVPLMSMGDSRDWLADRCRWLAVKNGREQVLALDDLWTLRKESWIKTGMVERSQQLQNQLPRLHPFYKNAAISMGRMYQAAGKGSEEEFKAAKLALSQDATDGRELEAASGAALDELEARK